MASDRFFRLANAFHRTLLRIPGRRVGWTAAAMPVLILTTIGRKTDRRRTVILTSPHQDGDTIVVVASKGGADRHPAWFLNLRDNPEVKIETADQPRHERSARVATPDQRTRLWPLITERFPNYHDYQSKTDREIPLVLLDRVS